MSSGTLKAWSIQTSKREISNDSRYFLKWQYWTNPVFDLNKPETFKFSLFRVGTDLIHRITLKGKPIFIVDALLFSPSYCFMLSLPLVSPQFYFSTSLHHQSLRTILAISLMQLQSTGLESTRSWTRALFRHALRRSFSAWYILHQRKDYIVLSLSTIVLIG